MVDLIRVRSVITGGTIGTGVATMYFLDNATCVASVRSFWNSMAPRFPNNVTINVQNAGDTIDAATGNITGSWLSPAEAPVTGTGGGVYAAPAGGLVRWLTSTVKASHRVKGRTFLVPLSAAVMNTSGVIDPTHLVLMQAAADGLRSSQSASFVVWSRPYLGRPEIPATATKPARPAKPARTGSSALVTSAVVPNTIVVLRSRRD